MSPLKIGILKTLNCLPSSFKKSLFHLTFNIARNEFERFSYLYASAPSMELGLAALAERGLRPEIVVDVGAFEGGWSLIARRTWPSCQIYMFEPNASKTTSLRARSEMMGNAKVFSDLLGASDDAEVEFNVMENGSSIMNERSPLPRTTETRKLTRLDTALPSLEGSTLLKIDAQGYELEVLKGASRVMDQVSAILLEVSVIEINEGAPLLADVLAYMSGIGFIACEVLEIHRRPLDRALNQIDFLFIRPDSHLFADKRHFA